MPLQSVSRKRKDYLQKACDLMMKYKSPDTVCGTVAQIARDGETAQVMTLKELRDRSGYVYYRICGKFTD